MAYEMIMTRAELEKDHAKWLQLRRSGLGGSDAGVILGLNNWKTPFSLWMEKTGQVESENLADSEVVYWGSVMEDVIAKRFEEVTGKKVRKSGMIKSKEHPFMLADIDRIVVGENSILEIKTTAYWNKEDWADDKLPASYYCQVLHYMCVCGAEKAYICCLIGGQKLVIKEVEFNQEDADALIKEEEKYWNEYVIPLKMPPVDGSTQCTEAIKKKYPGGEEEALDIEDEFDLLMQDRDKYKSQISALEKTVTEIENKIRIRMENHDFARSASYNIWYKTLSREGFDSKAFQKDYPTLYEKYRKTSAYRSLKIKISKARTKGVE